MLTARRDERLFAVDVAAAARATADKAAAGAGVTIRDATALDDLIAMNAVFEAVWGRAGTPPLNIARAIEHSGGYAVLAEHGGRVVAASLGFLGQDAGVPLLHSHITGAVPGAADRGVGYAVKQHQRAWCLTRGITTVTWTFDPLVRRNAYFNLTKVGAEATEYHANFYGAMDDLLNEGDETDRLLATWRLTDDRIVDAIAPAGAVVALDVDRAGAPVVTGASGATVLVRVPADIVAVRRDDAALGAAWRLAVRETLGAALAAGSVATGVTVDGAYVLRQP